MQPSLYRITTPVFIGVVIFLLTACSSTSSLSRETDGHSSPPKSEVEEQLREVNRTLEQETPTADLHYQKGYLMGELAQHKDEPAQRDSLYREMHRSLKEAEKLFQQAQLPSGKQKVDELLKVRWSSEHNQGVEIIQTDSMLTGKMLEKAAGHFKNATLILPDTAISYKMKAQAHYRNHNREKALAVLEKAYRTLSSMPAEMLEQLAFLYLETGQTDKAVELYEEAESFSNQNLNLLHGLANAYISDERHRKALQLLNRLLENEPQNLVYIQARGTQLHRLSVEKMKRPRVDTLAPEQQKEMVDQADSLYSKARGDFQMLLKQKPEETEIKETLADFYSNSAAGFQKALPQLKGDLKTRVRQTIQEFLEASIPLYISLAEQYPGKEKYTDHLFRAYTYLGRHQEASEIKSNRNNNQYKR